MVKVKFSFLSNPEKNVPKQKPQLLTLGKKVEDSDFEKLSEIQPPLQLTKHFESSFVIRVVIF